MKTTQKSIIVSASTTSQTWILKLTRSPPQTVEEYRGKDEERAAEFHLRAPIPLFSESHSDAHKNDWSDEDSEVSDIGGHHRPPQLAKGRKQVKGILKPRGSNPRRKKGQSRRVRLKASSTSESSDVSSKSDS